MMNVMAIDDCKARIEYDPDIEMFRGEFIGLNGGADFYAADASGLKYEGEISLNMFKGICREKGKPYRRGYSGELRLRLSPELHLEVATKAAQEGQSINKWIVSTVSQAVSISP